MSGLCLLLSDDLLDASRIGGHGRAAGLDVLQCRDHAALLSAVTRRPILAVLDLAHAGLELNLVVRRLQEANCKVIAYGPHVDFARLKEARAAGCDEVLPRSAFFGDIEACLTAWMHAQSGLPNDPAR